MRTKRVRLGLGGLELKPEPVYLLLSRQYARATRLILDTVPYWPIPARGRIQCLSKKTPLI